MENTVTDGKLYCPSARARARGRIIHLVAPMSAVISRATARRHGITAASQIARKSTYERFNGESVHVIRPALRRGSILAD